MLEKNPREDISMYSQEAHGIPEWRTGVDRRYSPQLLSVGERWGQVNRHVLGLYDWFRTKSQPRRIWQPVGGSIVLNSRDKTYREEKIDWSAVRKISQEPGDGGLHKDLGVIFQGLSDVEFYAADYANSIFTALASLPGGTGTNYARAAFNNAWASEESNHARFWALITQVTGIHTPDSLQDRADHMHARGQFKVPPNSVFHMIAYVVAQELATEVTYKKVGKILKGEHVKIRNNETHIILPGNEDPEILKGLEYIKRDEAAHFKFFKEVLEVVMYYFPEESLEAILYVTNPANFVMPSAGSIPEADYTKFNRVSLVNDVLNRNILATEVFDIVIKSMGMKEVQKWAEALQSGRTVTDADGTVQETALFTGADLQAQFNMSIIAERLNKKIGDMRAMYGGAGIDPDQHAPWSTSAEKEPRD